MLREPRPDVALITPYPRAGVRHGGHSGVASYAANLAHAMSAEGARVHVIAPAEPGEPAATTDGPVDITRPFRFGPGALPAALAAARECGAGVVHLQHEMFLYGGPNALPGLVSGLARGRSRRRRSSNAPATVVTMHQVVDPASIDGGYTRMHRMAVPPIAARLGVRAVQRTIRSFADAVLVHEPSFAAIMPGAVTVPHGIEGIETGTDHASNRSALGLDEKLTVLCFGFLAPYKGLEVAGDAARLLDGRVDLVIAGGPHPRLEARHGYARELQHTYGDVARFTGYVADDDVHRWFSAADVAVLPYPTPHSSSGALALALAHETPLLVSAAMSETSGLPVELSFTDATDLARRLDAMASEPQQRSAMQQAVSHLREERGWQAVAQRHLEVYDGLRAA
jgi:glycosyltransferase involved in cell wall biosynthesis